MFTPASYPPGSSAESDAWAWMIRGRRSGANAAPPQPPPPGACRAVSDRIHEQGTARSRIETRVLGDGVRVRNLRWIRQQRGTLCAEGTAGNDPLVQGACRLPGHRMVVIP